MTPGRDRPDRTAVLAAAAGCTRSPYTLAMTDPSEAVPGEPSGPVSPSSAVTMTAGLGETVLPDEERDVVDRLDNAAQLDDSDRREAVAAVVRDHPRSSRAWAELAALGRDDIESYAYYRVGYHRGLDALRAAGWRGSGLVTSAHPSNRGFLRCLTGLAALAGAIGESDEAERCRIFLAQLDPAPAGTSAAPASHAT